MFSLFRKPFKKLIPLLALSLTPYFFPVPVEAENRKAETNEVFLRVMPTLNAQLDQAMDLTEAGKFRDAINLLDRSLSICGSNNGIKRASASKNWVKTRKQASPLKNAWL
jgi:hypothetical protein